MIGAVLSWCLVLECIMEKGEIPTKGRISVPRVDDREYFSNEVIDVEITPTIQGSSSNGRIILTILETDRLPEKLFVCIAISLRVLVHVVIARVNNTGFCCH